MSAPLSRRHSRLELVREHQFRTGREDPAFFIEEWGSVLQVGKGWVPFKLWPHQHEIVTDKFQMIRAPVITPSAEDAGIELGPRSVDLKSRQVGFTTLACALSVHDMMFNESHPWILVSQGLDEAKGTLSTKISQFYSRLPRWVRAKGPNVTVDTKEEFGFDNGSSILSIPSTAHSARSKAVFGVIFDEAAFMEDAEAVLAALDPLCYGPLFMFSTANGMGNLFHRTYLDSLKPGSVWKSSFYPWSVVPGRTQKWYESQQRKLRESPHILAQEHPNNPAEAFLRSGRTALPVESIEAKASYMPPAFCLDLMLINDTMEGLRRAVLPPEAEPLYGLNVWEVPQIERNADGTLHRKPNYVISCDSAEGLEHGDYSAIVVADAYSGERVATMRSKIPIHYLGPVLETLGYWYHTALLVVERNAAGLVPLEHLRQAGYPRVYRQLDLAALQLSDRTPRFGWTTSNLTKPTMIHDWIKALEEDRIILHDVLISVEAQTYVVDKRGRYGAMSPNHDDLLSADFLVQQGIEDVPQFPPIFSDPRPGPMTFGDLFGPHTRRPENAGVALGTPIGDSVRHHTAVSFQIRSADAEARRGDSEDESSDIVYERSDPRENQVRR